MTVVPEEFLKTVVFLCVDRDDTGSTERVPAATGFILKVPLSTSPAISVDYYVTARHNIDRAHDFGSLLYVRVQLRDGGFEDIPTKLDDWSTHDTSDVAAILAKRISIKGKELDRIALSCDSLAGRREPYKYIGPAPVVGPVEILMCLGMELYCLGLFSQYRGEHPDLPIARYGHISRPPGVIDMKTTDGFVFHGLGYLAEFLSWGGISGSPVFFSHPMVVEDYLDVEGERIVSEVNHVHVTGLMGLLSGHYPIPEKAYGTGDIPGEIKTNLNSGIAVITPSDVIIELIEREDVMEEREKLGQAAKDGAKLIPEGRRPV